MSVSEEAKLIAECPACAYSLEGLPTVHRCPECGLAFDRRWRVFGGRNAQRHALPLIRFMMVWMILILLGNGVVVATINTRDGWQGLLVMASTNAAVLCIVWVALRRPRGFLAVGPAGLVLQRRRGAVEVIPWARLRGVKRGLLEKTVRLNVDGVWQRVPAFAVFRGDIGEAERCVHCIRRMRPSHSIDRRVESENEVQ